MVLLSAEHHRGQCADTCVVAVVVTARCTMTPLLWLLSLLVTTSGQASLTRVCNLQVVVDTLLWRQQMERVVQENITQEAAEVARVTRFQVTSLVSRLVNRANRVLDSYYFNDSKYKLSVRSIQV